MSPVREGEEGTAEEGSVAAVDAAARWLDHASARVSLWLFRLGIYVALPALVALVTLDVTLRYVFDAPLQWARDVNGLLLLTALFCSLPHAWDRAYHIRMEVFYDRLRNRNRRRVNVLSAVAGIIFFGMMAVQGARFVPFMIHTGETGEDLALPIWPAMAMLSVCALVMVARVFSNPAADEHRVEHGTRADGRP